MPLDPTLLARVEAAAKRAHVSLGAWEPRRLSCLGTAVPLRAMLEEVHAWLDGFSNTSSRR